MATLCSILLHPTALRDKGTLILTYKYHFLVTLRLYLLANLANITQTTAQTVYNHHQDVYCELEFRHSQSLNTGTT